MILVQMELVNKKVEVVKNLLVSHQQDLSNNSQDKC